MLGMRAGGLSPDLSSPVTADSQCQDLGLLASSPLRWLLSGLSGKCGHRCFLATAPAGQSLYWLVCFGPSLDSSVRKRTVVWVNN